MFERWLICLIKKGMFNDELVAKYDGTSFFVPKSQVKNDESGSGVGRVRVKTFLQNSKWFAVLPTDDQAIIYVNESDFVAA